MAALLLALFITGCETDDIPARVREKSAAFATLKPSEQHRINRGVIAVGFSSDMVYMAVGHPSKVESQATPEGTSELWTYNNYYPRIDARHLRYAALDPDSNYLPTKVSPRPSQPANLGRNRSPTLDTNAPLQGGSFEPADLQAYTLMVLFENGKVTRLGLSRS